MDNTFDEKEFLYRAVYPPEKNLMDWKDEEHISSAVFLVRNSRLLIKEEA